MAIVLCYGAASTMGGGRNIPILISTAAIVGIGTTITLSSSPVMATMAAVMATVMMPPGAPYQPRSQNQQ